MEEQCEVRLLTGKIIITEDSLVWVRAEDSMLFVDWYTDEYNGGIEVSYHDAYDAKVMERSLNADNVDIFIANAILGRV